MVRIEERMRIKAPAERCFDLARSIEVHLLGTERSGEQAVGGVTSGLIGAGQYVRWRAKHLGVRQHLTSRITAFERPFFFQDTMTEGAFRSMQHDHYFEAITPELTEMRDLLVFAAPVPVLGKIAEVFLLRGYMRRLLQGRNDVLRQVAESDRWKAFLPDA